MKGFDPSDRDLVVAAHNHVSAQFSQVLDEVVGKRVVIVEDKDHGRLLFRVHQSGWLPIFRLLSTSFSCDGRTDDGARSARSGIGDRKLAARNRPIPLPWP